MRMWMLPPKNLCKNHLLGEHKELHMLAGTLTKNKNIKGYLKKGLLEPQNMKKRHEALTKEMKVRGWQHQSPLKQPTNTPQGKVDKKTSKKDLLQRCKKCYEKAKQEAEP